VTDLSARVVLVTGVSSGIGRAVVLECLRRGHRVSGCARREDRLGRLRAESGAGPERLHLARADVTRPDETASWMEGAVGAFGRADAIVHNAGYGHAGAIEDLAVEDFREQLEVNFFAVVRLTREAIPLLVAAGGGDIVMVSSVVGLLAMPGRSAYCASKWALEGFAEAIRPELRHRGIRVSVVNPGFTESEFGQAMKYRGARPVPALERKQPAAEVAREIVSCLGRTRRHVILTGLGRAAVWLHRLAPALLDRIGEKRFLESRAAGNSLHPPEAEE